MANEESQQQGGEQSGSDESGPGSSEPITITTTDPAIESAVEHTADWKTHPDTTMCVETTQVHEPSPLFVAGVRRVISQDEASRAGGHAEQGRRSDGKSQRAGQGTGKSGRGGNQNQDDQKDEGGRDQNQGSAKDEKDQGSAKDKKDQGSAKDEKDQGQDQGSDQKGKSDKQQDGSQGKGKEQESSQKSAKDRAGGSQGGRHSQNRPGPRKEPSLMKNLMVTAGVAAICGLVGALGYSYFAGSSDKDSSGQSQSKGGSGSKKSSSSQSSSGGGSSKEGSSQSSSDESSEESKAALVAAQEMGSLNQQLVDLMVRVDRLGERVDRVVRPNDETPPVIQSLQIEIGEIFHELDKTTSLADKVRANQNRLDSVTAELKALRSRIDALATMTPATLASNMPPATTAAAAPAATTDIVTPNPELEQGIRLLAKGQYEPARSFFEHLKRTQPGDARVWYLGALAVGLASGDWNDEAQELVQKGLERERAGSPSTAQIDATLAASPPIKGEEWLSGIRRRSLGANRTP